VQALGVFGGTFDPIHYGHLRPAQVVRERLALESLLIVPAPHPPHRRQPVAAANHRLRMVQLACEEFPGFKVDDREYRRGGPSFTVLTLESLRSELGARPICLLLGMDAYEDLETWHEWTRLPQLAHLVVMTRPGWEFPGEAQLPVWARGRVVHEARALAQVSAGCIFFQPVPPEDISATAIRGAIARGESVRGQLPDAVWEYICTNRLYQPRGADAETQSR
jgi:nicotinate-nucleotide adenylyltransferase